MREVWKDIYFKEKGIVWDYRGVYQISNFGRVKSLMYWSNIHKKYYSREKILEHKIDRKGYHRIELHNKGTEKTFSIHRLVAIMFIPNPNNLPEVNHDDGKKGNCCVSNLYWCTRGENIQHAYKKGLRSSEKLKEYNKKNKSKKVVQYDLKGNFIKEYISLAEAEKQTKVWAANISACCRGENQTAGGFKWRFEDENNEL